ncbi:hypothetical protein [Sandaracinobacteroides saxicola]|uniref:beta-fructofuranosidase n=1 Tax=Sandaracinobacteroides saxicola TaxID=2759707 RepID=A0A7G5IEW9_9SPHN|nr:hypothetical protein [Sandaracinobacteroides saxicola]QMW21911.1 hypothetical protein H3309_11000 [Sandaracinobacteroides saxicola]
MMAFHAHAPAGEWLNDPNGLLFSGGRWRLFAQHRADAPDFAATGWARLSGDDLLRWDWDGVAIPAGDEWAYSGCVLPGPVAVHTAHAAGLERQVLRRSGDGGRTWGPARALDGLGGAARNRRDPFVWPVNGGWRMLLAAPCDWRAWRDEGPSRLLLFEAEALEGPWRAAGEVTVGLPRGVMLEMPARVAVPGGGEALVWSTVDRRGDGADGTVWRWDGGFADGRWQGSGTPCRLDLGPDFYAAIPGGDMLIGWASSWATARAMPWGGFHGGPLSLPRAMTAAGSAPVPAIADRFSVRQTTMPAAGLGVAAVAGVFSLRIEGHGAAFTLAVAADGAARLERTGDFAWGDEARLQAGPKRLSLFVDGPLVELHIAPDDRWVTVAVPVVGAFAVHGVAFDWFGLAD